MVTIDQPSLPVDVSSIALVAKSGQHSSTSALHIAGICKLVPLDSDDEANEGLDSAIQVEHYYKQQYDKTIDLSHTTVHVIQRPAHGSVTVSDASSLSLGQASYSPDKGYIGNDTLVLKVEGADYILELHYFLRVVGFSGKQNYDDMFDNPDCQDKQSRIISSTLRQLPHTLAGNTLTQYFVKDVAVSLSIANLDV